MHWEEKGKVNTDKTIDLALKRAKELNIVCVSYHVGFYAPGEDNLPKKVRSSLINQGMSFVSLVNFEGLIVIKQRRKNIKNSYLPKEVGIFNVLIAH